jgi:hypothetical protein
VRARNPGVRHAVAVANWGSRLRRAARSGLDLVRPRRAPAPPRRSVRTAPTRDRARTIAYAPRLDGAADPGEVVWAWVPYEEGDGRGKDRPLLIVGRHRAGLLGLMLSSRPDHAGERDWVSVGSGPWDRQGRESFARLDRVLEVAEDGIRREGAVLDRDRFDRVARELRTRFGWA